MSVDTQNKFKEIKSAIQEFNVSPIFDYDVPFKGPYRAFYSSLHYLQNENIILFLPGDMPWIETEAIRKFINLSTKVNNDISTIFWSNGIVETLIQIHRPKRSFNRAHLIKELKIGVVRPSDLLRGVSRTFYVHISNITNDPKCFGNVNIPSDLVNPSIRGEIYPVKENIVVYGDVKGHYLRGIVNSSLYYYSKAIYEFHKEGTLYDSYGLHHIAKHCSIDILKLKKYVGQL